MSNNSYYWENKNARAKSALAHVEDMENRYKNEIANSVNGTIVCDGSTNSEGPSDYEIELIDIDSVSAVLNANGKTCVLNFASYKHPGGMYLNGSRAQEECLCHESTLYNVLKTQKKYYEYNNSNLNRSMYFNRGLYSPDIIFERDGNIKKADVLTCAAPNFSAASKYGLIDAKANSRYIRSRIEFLLSHLSDKDLDTIILGAFGCGVFGQDPTEVATIFLDTIPKVFHSNKKTKFVFAVIDANSNNYEAFNKVINNRKEK